MRISAWVSKSALMSVRCLPRTRMRLVRTHHLPGSDCVWSAAWAVVHRAIVQTAPYTRRRAREFARCTTAVRSRSVEVGAPRAAYGLDGAAGFGVFLEPVVDPSPALARFGDQCVDRDAAVGCGEQRPPQPLLGRGLRGRHWTRR